MDFNLTTEQELLRDGLARFLSTRYDLEKSRAAAKTGAGLAARHSGGDSPTNSASWAPPYPKMWAESAAARSKSW